MNPATIEQLRAAFGASDEAFCQECLKNKCTMEGAWKAKAEANAKSATEAQAQAAAAIVKAGGVGEQKPEKTEEPKADAGTEPVAAAATHEQLGAAFPDNPAFCMDCLKNKRSMEQAWKAKAEAEAKAAAEARATITRLGSAGAGGHGGVAPAVGAMPGGAGGVIPAGGAAATGVVKAGESPYDQEVARVQAADNCSYGEAINKVNKSRPDLRKSYVGGLADRAIGVGA